MAPSSALQPKENQSASRDVTTRTNRLGVCWIAASRHRCVISSARFKKTALRKDFLRPSLHCTNWEELVWAVEA